MKKTIMFLLSGVLAIALFSCPVIASVSVNFCEYLPLSVGNKWTYVGDSSKLYYTEIIGTEIINGEFTFQETQKDKDDYNNRICEADKIKEVGQNGVAWDSPRYWDGIDVITAEHKQLYSIEPQVVTPAGTFTNVIKISYFDINETNGQFALSRVEYWAKGVGMVKDVNYWADDPVNPGSYTNTYLLHSFDLKPTLYINLSDYRNWSTVGSWWTYSYIYPLGLNDFTVSISKITSGEYNGMLRIGDWYEYHPSDPQIYWIVYEIFDGYLNIYQYGDRTSDIPWILNEHELECFASCNVYPDKKWYVRKEDKITVPAGTFYDILVMFDIDSGKGYPPNSANYTYGLDPVEVPYAVTNIHWYARNFGEVKGIDIDSATGNIVHRYELKSFHIPDSDGVPTDIRGNVTYNGTPLCAMVLANGQYMFSCGENQGKYELEVPLDANGEITLFAFVDGLAPFKQILTPSEALDFDIEMELAGPDSKMPTVTRTGPESVDDPPGWVKFSGFVSLEGTPLCAMVLANGQYMFSCDPDGEYQLSVPLDGNGEITLFVFVDGLQPYKEIIRP